MTVENAGERYRSARPFLEAAYLDYEKTVRECVKRVPDVYVMGRVKSQRSTIRKMRGGGAARSWDSITDKVGIRVICSTTLERRTIDELLRSLDWTLLKRDEKRPAADELGYAGTHLEVVDSNLVDDRQESICCEIQVRTRAQDAWSVISHRIAYKGLLNLPRKLKRTINRLTVFVEVFDEEVSRAFKKQSRLPMYRQALALEHVEQRFEAITGEPPDDAIDLTIISTLLDAYTESEAGRFGDIIDSFCAEEETLARDIASHSPASPTYQDSADWLFTQPEILVVLERAKSAPWRLANAVAESDLDTVVRRTCVSVGRALPDEAIT